MHIVIEIDEETYNDIKRGKIYRSCRDVPQESVVAIANGTPLPKRHGRLIDADTLEECKEVMNTIMNECEYAVRMTEVRNVPTIIEGEV